MHERPTATLLSFHQVEKPKTNAYHGPKGQDRRRMCLTIHVPDGDDYQAEPIWRFGDPATAPTVEQQIEVDVHADKPWAVWPRLPHVDYGTGDLAAVFYRAEHPTS
jgi:hypothetical protein